MSLVAAGVGGVSTYAWYQTTQTVTASAGTAQGYTVTVSGPADAAANFDYVIDATVTKAGSKTLILSQWVTNEYKSYTLDAGLQKVEHTVGSGEELVSVFEVKAKGTWGSSASSLTEAAKAAMLAANTQTYTVTFSKDSTNDARAYFVTQANNTIGNFSTNTNQTLSLAVSSIGTDYVSLGYLLVRVDGENKSGDNNVADNGSTFTVKINATGSVA